MKSVDGELISWKQRAVHVFHINFPSLGYLCIGYLKNNLLNYIVHHNIYMTMMYTEYYPKQQ